MDRYRQLSLRDIASTSVHTVAPETPLDDAIALMAREQVSCLVVVSGRRPVGIITEQDLVRLMSTGIASGIDARAVMSAPLITARLDLDFPSAQNLLGAHAIRHLVVTDDGGELLGIVSESDFRAHLELELFERLRSIESVMDPEFTSLYPDDTLRLGLERMTAGRLDHVIVAVGGIPLGILTERDIPRLLAAHLDPATTRLDQVMSTPLHTLTLLNSAADATTRMDETRVRHMAVVDLTGHIVGVISQHRMLERLSQTLQDEIRTHLQTRLDLILHATGVGTWEYDCRTDRLACSPAMGAILGHDADAPPAGPLQASLDRIHPDDRPVVDGTLQAARDNDSTEPFALDCRIRKSDGQWMWLRTRGRVMERDVSGQALAAAGIAIDITAEMATARRATDSELRFQHLLERVPVPLCHVGQDGRILFINERFRQVFGYTLEDVPDLDAWWRCAYPDANYRASVVASWNASLARRGSRDERAINPPREYRIACKDGALRTLEVSGIALGQDFLASFVDVTGRKSVEEELNKRVAELRRWYEAMLGRETRVLELKREVNSLLARLGEAPRYTCTEPPTSGQP